MTPGTYNFTIYKDVSFAVVFTFLDSAGDAIPLTGLTAKAQGRAPTADSQDYIDLLPSVTDAAAGEVTISLTQEQVYAFPENIYTWSMVFQQDSDGQRIGPYVIGTLTVTAISTHIP